jgi:hypothetical protein
MNAFKLMACATVLTAIFASCSNDKTLTETGTPLTTSVGQPASSDAAGNLQAENATLSIDPANGSVGVTRTQSTIKVTFDEAMTQAGTQAVITVFGTAQTPGGEITRDLKPVVPVIGPNPYQWDADGKILTITLDTSLEDREVVKVTVPRGTPTLRTDSSDDGRVGTQAKKFASFRAAHREAVNFFAGAQGCVNNSLTLLPFPNFSYVGDRVNNTPNRCLYSFDMSSLPAGILRIVPDSRLFLHQQIKFGNPSLMEPEVVERVDPGLAIDGADYDLIPLNPATNIIPAAITPGWASARVNDAIWSAYATPSKRLDLRVRFETAVSANGANDGYLYSGINGLINTNKPRVTVKYETE